MVRASNFLGGFWFPCCWGGFYHSDGWVGGWVGGMGQFGMISPHGLAPFLVWDMDRPLSLTCCPPGLPSLMHFRATRCIHVYFETGTLC